MFTGIVQTVGTVRDRRETDAGLTFSIVAGDFSSALRPGDSVSINGTCHTVETCDADGFTVTSVRETLERTTMSGLKAGSRVNLEQAATLETPLGGHMVQGHVDGIGNVVSVAEGTGGEWMLTVRVPQSVHDVVVEKGSIAIDGVSLTVARRGSGGELSVAIVPYTRAHTIVDAYQAGTPVNVEADVLGKYVHQYLERIGITRPGGNAEPGGVSES